MEKLKKLKSDGPYCSLFPFSSFMISRTGRQLRRKENVLKIPSVVDFSEEPCPVSLTSLQDAYRSVSALPAGYTGRLQRPTTALLQLLPGKIGRKPPVRFPSKTSLGLSAFAHATLA